MSNQILPVVVIGAKYSRLTVRESLGVDKHKKRLWLCDCECGKTVRATSRAIATGNTKSCGCLRKERIGAQRRTHGKSKSLEYQNWCAIKSRCDNPDNQDYALYGGRGITVCDRWANSFENFLEDMGQRPFKSATVDRKDPSGNYTPDNCKWATQKQQCRNKRNNRLLTANGETLPICEWAERSGVSQGTIWSRLSLGWSEEEAATLPRQQRFSGPHARCSTK